MPEFTPPIATVDVALFTLRGGLLQVCLLRREAEPFAGHEALVGGYVHQEEDRDLEATAVRVLRAKVGVEVPYLEQLYTFSGRYRDPRGWSLSVAYYALVPEAHLDAALAAGRVATRAVDPLPDLPFDHPAIVAKALARLRGKATYSSLPAFLLPATFTLPELQEVYEQVMGVALDRSTFRRKVLEQGIVAEAPGTRPAPGKGRPFQLYRLPGRGLKESGRTLFES